MEDERTDKTPIEDIENEVIELERRLVEAKGRLEARRSGSATTSVPPPQLTASPDTPFSTSGHFLLLLSDSALPLGSFAFSSGLESFLAHSRQSSSTAKARNAPPTTTPQPTTPQALFHAFLPLSLSSYAAAALPFVLAAHRDPSPHSLAALDDALDAAVICTVGRRASVAQGRALLGVWDRCFAPGAPPAAGAGEGARLGGTARDRLRAFAAVVRAGGSAGDAAGGSSAAGSDDDALPAAASAHLPPLFGAVSEALGLSARQAAYVFLLGQAKAVVSAAVRAGVLGPYQAQRALAGAEVRELLGRLVDREWESKVEEAGQNAPVMDLWMGRHEMLYSRIFNS